MDESSGCNGGDFDMGESKGKKHLMKPPRHSNPSEISSCSNKRKRSTWWVHYNEVDDVNYAKCKYCGVMIGCASKNGTSGLKNHINRCKKFPANNEAPSMWKFDQEAARKAIVRMVIVDELPFSFVECEGFRNLCKAMNPAFDLPSRHDIIRDIYLLFIEERKRLKDFLSKLSSRVSLTTDAWTSGQGFCYLRLTAHFIDDDWVLHRSVINFCALDDHSGQLSGRAVEQCSDNWGIKNIMAVTMDNAGSNDLAIDYLRGKHNGSESSILNGKYLHIRCIAQILNSAVIDGLKDMDHSIWKVRAVIRYVRSSLARLRRFKACVEEERLETDGLVYLDTPTRWDETYLMLQSALKFQKAYKLFLRDFSCVSDIKECGDDVPNDEDWTKLGSFLPILKVCYDATKIFSGSRHVTCNDNVHNVFAIGLAISKCCNHEDEGFRKMAHQMKLKYDQYWGDVSDINHLLFVALLLDPRRKMKYVDWLVSSTYSDTKAELLVLHVKILTTELFELYASSMPQAASSSAASPGKYLNEIGEGKALNFAKLLTMKFEKETGSLDPNKTELDKYLGDPCESDVASFSILRWWKDHQKRYPVLSKMARDVLAMPISTVAADSAFRTEGSVLDSFRTSMPPTMVEALFCTKDWISSTLEIPVIEEELPTLEELVEEMEDLSMEHPKAEPFDD